jgi:hypothetical protein
MVQQLVSFDALEFPTEPLDEGVKWHLKTIWDQEPFLNCGATVVRTWDDLDRIWRRGCGFMSTYTLGTPFYDAELVPVSPSSLSTLR